MLALLFLVHGPQILRTSKNLDVSIRMLAVHSRVNERKNRVLQTISGSLFLFFFSFQILPIPEKAPLSRKFTSLITQLGLSVFCHAIF